MAWWPVGPPPSAVGIHLLELDWSTPDQRAFGSWYSASMRVCGYIYLVPRKLFGACSNQTRLTFEIHRIDNGRLRLFLSVDMPADDSRWLLYMYFAKAKIENIPIFTVYDNHYHISSWFTWSRTAASFLFLLLIDCDTVLFKFLLEPADCWPAFSSEAVDNITAHQQTPTYNILPLWNL